ncbi:unnamed protein product, partial [Lymnaea stagnalis]
DNYICAKTDSPSSQAVSNGYKLRSRSPQLRSRVDRSASSSPKFRTGINGSL